MTQRQIEELLNQQADKLVAGQKLPGMGRAAQPASAEHAELSAEEKRSLSSLMSLARQLQSVFVEIEPRPSFVVDSKARLVSQRQAQPKPAAASGRGMLWLAGLAGALSVAGLGFLGYRAARAGAGWISSAAASRNARPSLPKA